LIEAEEWTGIIEPEYSLFDIQLGHSPKPPSIRMLLSCWCHSW